MGEGLVFTHNTLVYVFDCLDRMTINMGTEWAGDFLAADLDQSVIAGESENSIYC